MPSLHSLRRTALAIALAAGAASHAQTSGSCPPATLELCKTPGYTESACGAPQFETCRALIDSVFVAYWYSLPPERPITLPDFMGGGVAMSRPVPYDASQDVSFGSGSYAAFLQLAQVIARKPPAALNAVEQALNQQKAQWAANGQAITSCTEYVYEKNLGLSEWLESVGRFPGDDRAVFQDAVGPYGIAGPLYARDGSPVTIAWPDAAPKNAYYRFSPGPYPSGFPAYAFDPDVLGRISSVGPASEHPSLSWHQAKSQALEGIPDRDLESEDARQQTFTQLLDARQKAWADYLRASSSATSDPELPPRTADALRALDAQLDDLLRQARDAGCLEAGQVTRCDWSPALFRRQIVAATVPAQEADYQRCARLTHDDFGPGGVMHNALNLGIPGAAQNEYALNLPDFIGLIDLLTPNNPTPETVPQGMKDYYRQYVKTLSRSEGNWLLRGGYDGHIGWGIRDYQGPQDNLCRANLFAYSDFRATATLLDHWTWELVSGRGAIETIRDDEVHVEANLRVLGNDIFQPVNQTFHAEFTTGPQSASYDLPFVFDFPYDIVIIKVGARLEFVGHLGLDYSLSGGIIRDCEHKDLGAGIDGAAKPWGRIDTAVTAYAEILGGAGYGGIKGSVMLVRAELPVDAHLGVYTVAPDNNLGLRLNAICTASADIEALSGRVDWWAGYDIWFAEDRWDGFWAWNGISTRIPLVSADYNVQLAALQ